MNKNSKDTKGRVKTLPSVPQVSSPEAINFISFIS